MIVPSIDLMGGHAVQLVGGKEVKIDAGDPLPVAERFAVAGELAVIDLDAALGRGANTEVVAELVRRYPCRVGGGIRDAEAALRWLDRGAERVILGTAATPEVLGRLPRERVVAALDAVDGEVVVRGWTERTGRTVEEGLEELAAACGQFMVTFVEREGRMGGIDEAAVRRIVERAGPARVTVAGGVTTAEEVAGLDRMGADAQVGMALYEGTLDLGDAVGAPLVGDRDDGLFPTVVVDERGIALGLCWSSRETLRAAVRERRGIYWSRRRGAWRKGETSGDVQALLRVDLDCDRDALRFVVRQHGRGFCHVGTRTCWGPERGVGALVRLLEERRREAPEGSYTRRLLEDPGLLRAKLVEEAEELAAARGREAVAHEAADVLYFALVAAVRGGVGLHEVEQRLDRRARRVTRRKGDAK